MNELADQEPLWDEAGFADFLQGLAQDDAPRLFAIAHEYGTRQDGWIAAWGMAFADRADVVSTEGDFRATAKDPDSALATFERFKGGEDVKLHLLWVKS
ncbi:hypothetical protein [Saccharothrix coeruleofusca]|uniref:Uncharacterized protein n=1 Tax=Saccharothrix coeruleofusca TaxID=33919 RepID=A0A918ECH6_9PSEU|nr:hypothetical protein [Saccharothrix coeruleofusca]MBP2334092.1 hypothetical protein [Saccharothrix coeruleofusca]GGP43480.1 hypothetical protein GCM10010185_13890 [Saccharothrix coeruleofusca]